MTGFIFKKIYIFAEKIKIDYGTSGIDSEHGFTKTRAN